MISQACGPFLKAGKFDHSWASLGLSLKNEPGQAPGKWEAESDLNRRLFGHFPGRRIFTPVR
jgi:hypothetical protein